MKPTWYERLLTWIKIKAFAMSEVSKRLRALEEKYPNKRL